MSDPPDISALVGTVSAGVHAAPNVVEAIAIVRSAYGLDHVTYHLVQTLLAGVDSPFVRTTYPIEWVGTYVIRQYVDKDPVIRSGITRSAPFDWDSLSAAPGYDEVIDAAQQFGIGRRGYSIPIIDKRRRRALLSINSRMPAENWRLHVLAHAGDWIDIAQIIHRKAVFEAYGERDPLPKLGTRELECLTWTARGKEAKEIAAVLKISPHTVQGYLKSARYKLDCATLSQAVSQALKFRLIMP